VIIYAVLVGVGLLLAHPLARLVSGEDGLSIDWSASARRSGRR